MAVAMKCRRPSQSNALPREDVAPAAEDERGKWYGAKLADDGAGTLAGIDGEETRCACGNVFYRLSPNRKKCDQCQDDAYREKVQRANRRINARVSAERADRRRMAGRDAGHAE